jgi:hypothetical protein
MQASLDMTTTCSHTHIYFPCYIKSSCHQLKKLSGPQLDHPQIHNSPDKDLPFVTSNPLYPDKDRAIFKS